MIVKTLLLISDDPDDHIEFSEALYEISDDTVLLTVSDFLKAIDLWSLKKCVPEFIFINVGIGGFEPEVFFRSFDGPELRDIRVVAYGEAPEFGSLSAYPVTAFLDTDISFSELKGFLERVVKGEG